MNPERMRLKARAMMNCAVELGGLSCCRKRQVGALVTTRDFSTVLAIGYNGPARGLPNDSCDGGRPCGCVHAEANALVKCMAGHGRDLVMFCTLAPCPSCAKLILNNGCVSRVVYLDEWLRSDGRIDSSGLDVLRSGGIPALMLGRDC